MSSATVEQSAAGMVEPAADSAKDPAPAPAFGPAVAQGSGSGLSSSLLMSLPQKTNSAPVTPLADLLRNVDVRALHYIVAAATIRRTPSFLPSPIAACVRHPPWQLWKLYDTLKGFGYAEADDFQAATHDELEALGMTPMEAAKLRSVSTVTPIFRTLSSTQVRFRSGGVVSFAARSLVGLCELLFERSSLLRS